MIAFLLYKLASLATRTLPPRLIYGLAALLAQSHYLLDRRARAAVTDNLRHILGPGPSAAELRRIARRVFLNFAKNVVDFLRLPGLDSESLQDMLVVEGWENVERARAQGHGIIILSAHLGNWELGGVFLSMRGLGVNEVVLDHVSPRVTRFFAAHRESQGVRNLPARDSAFAIIRALRRGEVVCIVGDRDVTGQGVVAPFFGAAAVVPRAHASIAIKTGAPVVPAFMLQEPGGRFRCCLLPEVRHDDLPDEQRLELFVQRCLRVIEARIREHPDQWFTFQRTWGAAGEATATAAAAARDGRAR